MPSRASERTPPPRDARRAIDAVWRIESARVIGGLARLVHDLGWGEGPAPGALVSAVAERRQDELGRREEREHATSELDMAAAADDAIGDDMLSLLFATCHPMLS